MTQEGQPLPRGCYVLPSIAPSSRDLLSRVFDWKLARDTHGFVTWMNNRERVVYEGFNKIVSLLISGSNPDGILNFMQQTLPGEKLSVRTQVGQAVQELRHGDLAVASNVRLGIQSRKLGRKFAYGGEFEGLGVKGTDSQGYRGVRVKFIGVILNAQSPLADSYKKPTLRPVTGEIIAEIADSLIEAKKCLEKARQEGKVDQYMSQAEIDKALFWLYGQDAMTNGTDLSTTASS